MSSLCKRHSQTLVDYIRAAVIISISIDQSDSYLDGYYFRLSTNLVKLFLIPGASDCRNLWQVLLALWWCNLQIRGRFLVNFISDDQGSQFISKNSYNPISYYISYRIYLNLSKGFDFKYPMIIFKSISGLDLCDIWALAIEGVMVVILLKSL